MQNPNKKIITLVLSLAFFNLIAWTGFSFYNHDQNQKLQNINNKLDSFENKWVSKQQFDALVEKSKKSSNELDSLMEAFAEIQNKPKEIIRQEIIKQKSQDEILTEAVQKITPTVVSIVITKDVPQLEIVYINPFGDDPFFQDFDIKVPRYRQKGTEEKKVGAGTGFLINKNGYILTNKHVVNDEEAKYTALLSDGSQKSAIVIYKDEKIDIAIIKVEGSGFSHVQFGDSDSLKLGQSVFAVGNALGEYSNSVSTGIISGLNRDLTASGSIGSEKLEGVIQTDAAINPGNSGGPLVTLEGKVIGVNVATVIGSNNISFSIPINEIKKIINSVIK
ncbi:MAG: trypsin-like peptidase domain-containing protein [Patescibacteria group bacterium]|nr:trypsin-like peptidase domain-containing protein [Patescibacteria group bacterium]